MAKMNPLHEQLRSKKFRAMVLGVITTIAAKYGLHLDAVTLSLIAGLFAAYIGGQAAVDVQKQKAAE